MIRSNKGIKFNRNDLRDKIHACWIGKNIGGTLGCPIEGIRSVCDVKGFQSDDIIANDDFDLQLIWLRAIDEQGIERITGQTLGEYWLSYAGPWWNEYGICKRNMQEGLMAPMCGAVANKQWENSNGAWIRTEVWACVSPGCPEQAARLAFEDASVDHGFGEGTYAAMFVAALESAAFVVKDIRKLIEIGLAKIPEQCEIARCVNVVLECYDKKVSWESARNKIVEEFASTGWMQAPYNVAFTVIGLLYGENDFKKTVLCAVNCGDDTDCTGATAGAVMGILGGTNVIPEDWHAFVGDRIKTIAIIEGHGEWPSTCGELTESVMRLLPASVRQKTTYSVPECLPIPESFLDYPIEIYDGENDFSVLDIQRYKNSMFLKKLKLITQNSHYALRQMNEFSEIWVELDREPVIGKNDSLSGRIRAAIRNMPEQKWFNLRWICPEEFWVEGRYTISTDSKDEISWDDDTNGRQSAEDIRDSDFSTVSFTIHSGEYINPTNRIILEISVPGRPVPVYIPVTLLA